MATATNPNYKFNAKRATAIKIGDVRGNEHCMKLEGVSARNNVDYSSVKNTKQKSSIKSQSTLTR